MDPIELKKTKHLEGLYEELKIIFNNLKISVGNISSTLDAWEPSDEKASSVIMDDASLYEKEGAYSILAKTIEAIKQLTHQNNDNVNRLNKII